MTASSIDRAINQLLRELQEAVNRAQTERLLESALCALEHGDAAAAFRTAQEILARDVNIHAIVIKVRARALAAQTSPDMVERPAGPSHLLESLANRRYVLGMELATSDRGGNPSGLLDHLRQAGVLQAQAGTLIGEACRFLDLGEVEIARAFLFRATEMAIGEREEVRLAARLLLPRSNETEGETENAIAFAVGVGVTAASVPAARIPIPHEIRDPDGFSAISAWIRQIEDWASLMAAIGFGRDLPVRTLRHGNSLAARMELQLLEELAASATEKELLLDLLNYALRAVGENAVTPQTERRVTRVCDALSALVAVRELIDEGRFGKAENSCLRFRKRFPQYRAFAELAAEAAKRRASEPTDLLVPEVDQPAMLQRQQTAAGRLLLKDLALERSLLGSPLHKTNVGWGVGVFAASSLFAFALLMFFQTTPVLHPTRIAREKPAGRKNSPPNIAKVLIPPSRPSAATPVRTKLEPKVMALRIRPRVDLARNELPVRLQAPSLGVPIVTADLTNVPVPLPVPPVPTTESAPISRSVAPPSNPTSDAAGSNPDSDGIQSALWRYSEAWAAKDAAGITAVRPGIGRRVLKTELAEARHINMRIVPTSPPRIEGDRATVECLHQVDQMFNDGVEKQSPVVHMTYVLVKRNGAWLIADSR